MLLGCIADDFTGATDLANALTRRGMHAVLTIGVPKGTVPAAEAVVVALKTRTTPAPQAIAGSLAACRWLKSAGARQILLQILLDLRLDGRGKHRAGRRCAPR